MNTFDYLRLSLRGFRRSAGRVTLFVLCIAVGVAAIVLVQGLSNSVVDTVRSEGRRLAAADLDVEARRPMPSDLDDMLRDYEREQNLPIPIERADLREFVSVVLNGDSTASQLAELKVVDGGYPFYGELILDPNRPLGELLTPDTVVVAPGLLERLGMSVGDTLRVGGAEYEVAGTVVQEPDKLEISFTLGPRVFMSQAGLMRTSLLDRGARVEYRALLKLPDGSTATDAERLQDFLNNRLPPEDDYDVDTFTDAQPQLRRSFDRMGRYLGLVGLLSLLVGGVGVAQVARVWLRSRMDDVAILRCVGATPWQVVLVFTIQVLAMALVGSGLGAALGTLFHWLVPRLSGGLLPVDLVDPWQPGAIAWGMFLGTAISLVFTLPLLIALRRVPPVRVLRRDAEPTRGGWGVHVVAGVIIFGSIWWAAVAQAEDFEHGSIFVAGLIGAILALAIVAVGVSKTVVLVPRRLVGLRLRHGLASLSRPGAATLGAVVALGLGVTFVFAVHLVRRHLSDELIAELPDNAPTTFFLDVQTDQLAGLKQMLGNRDAAQIDSQPIITSRFAAIRGYATDDLLNNRDGSGDRPRVSRRRLTRELRVTYGPELPRGNAVVAGSWPSPFPNAISIEQEFADDLDVTVGDTLTLDVQGVPVELTVGSIRTINWRTFGINFFLFAEPGPLDDAPQTHVAVARLETADLPGVQTAVAETYPNVTVIHIREILEKVKAVLDNLAIAVTALGGFIVAAGILVLGGTVAANGQRRARETALLKTIGMTRTDVAIALAGEHALVGLVAAGIGVLFGGLLAYGVVSELMDLPWHVRPAEPFIAAAVTVALSMAAGLAASARAIAARPADTLRAE